MVHCVYDLSTTGEHAGETSQSADWQMMFVWRGGHWGRCGGRQM